MREIYIDISKDSGNSITTIQGNNNNKVYKLIVTDNNKRLDLTGKSVKMAYVNTFGDGDIIEGLQIINAVQGEISLPITNILTKQDGNYGCQLAIYNSSGFLEHTGSFSLIVKENLFNRISSGLLKTTTYQKLISILEKSEEMVANLHDAREVNSSLSNNINSGTNLDTNLSGNIKEGNSLNAALTKNKQDAAVKNTELNKSLEKTKKYIDGLDGSQNIPQIRMDITELQNGLKANQSLEYEGYNVTCNNTLEGRTEGMELRGRTLQNLISYSKTWRATGWNNFVPKIDMLKVNTDYTILTYVSNNTFNSTINIACDTNNNSTQFISPNLAIPQGFNGVLAHKARTKDSFDDVRYSLYSIHDPNIITGSLEIKIVIMEGYHNYIPSYFEGIKSVGEDEINLLEESQIVDGYITKEGSQYKFITGSNTSTAIIPCDPNTTYTIVKETSTDRFAVGVRDSPIENGSIVDVLKEVYTTSSVITVTTPSYARYIAVYLTKNITNEPVGKVGIYKSVNSFQWSPYNKAKISTLSTGKNLVENKFILNRTLASDGTTAVDYYADRFTTEDYSIINIGDYIISCSRNFNGVYIAEYDCNKKFIVRNFISQGNKFTINNIKTCYIRVSILGVTDFENLTLQVEKGNTRTSFEPYREDKKEILLNQPLRALTNGLSDRIFERDGKVVLEKNIHKYIFNGTENWTQVSYSAKALVLQLDISEKLMGVSSGQQKYFISNYNIRSDERWNVDDWKELAPIAFNTTNKLGKIEILISKEKLTSIDGIDTFKNMIRDNNLILYLPLSEPIITELTNIKDLDLSVFQDVTHIMSINSIPAELKFKIASNIGSILQQQSKNINDLYRLIDEILVPQITNNTLDIELLKNK